MNMFIHGQAAYIPTVLLTVKGRLSLAWDQTFSGQHKHISWLISVCHTTAKLDWIELCWIFRILSLSDLVRQSLIEKSQMADAINNVTKHGKPNAPDRVIFSTISYCRNKLVLYGKAKPYSWSRDISNYL